MCAKKKEMINRVKWIKDEFEPVEKGIVGIWDVITKVLAFISILEIICVIYKSAIGYDRQTYCKVVEKWKNKQKLNDKEHIIFLKMQTLYKLVNIWVSAQACIALGCSLVVFYFFSDKDKVMLYTITIYGLLRVFEIIVKQIRVLLFETVGEKAIFIKSPRRSIILLIHNIFEIIFWFATVFMAGCYVDKNMINVKFIHLSEIFRWSDFIKASTLQFTVFGDEISHLTGIQLENFFILDLAFWESIVGFIIIVTSVARFFSLLPTVNSEE